VISPNTVRKANNIYGQKPIDPSWNGSQVASQQDGELKNG